MLLSSFGLPLPEEVIIITSSLLAYMALHPEVYPPPEAGMKGVNVYVLMTVCFFAVFLSDLLVFQIGRALGKNITHKKWFKNLIKPQTFRKVKFWTQKYGPAAAGIFRFIPGVRFPGHMACGALGISRWKFMLVDISVVLITIPTQVYLISTYGEEILAFMKKFKFLILLIAVLVLAYIGWSIYSNIKYIQRKNEARKAKLV